MFHFFKKIDSQLKDDVVSELNWEPSVTSTDISVSAVEGIITLRGRVPHYSQKAKAEKAAQRVSGVRAVADEMEVDLTGANERSDVEMSKTALTALEWNYSVPEGIKVSVEKGWITLRGEAQWGYQRVAAEEAVSDLKGVRGITNEITIEPVAQTAEVKRLIEEALRRSSGSEVRAISVAVDGARVILSGNVHTFAEIEDAGRAAWNAVGVRFVENNLMLAS